MRFYFVVKFWHEFYYYTFGTLLQTTMNRFIPLLLFFSGCVFSQSDSLSVLNKRFENRKTQTYTIDANTERIYYQPKWHEPITNLWHDFKDTNRDFIADDHAWYLGGALAATAVMIPLDQNIIDESRRWADKIGLSPDNKYGNLGPLSNIPQNTGAAFYLVGNGTTVLLLSAGFMTHALFTNDYRAYATASGMLESMALSGFYIQVLKRTTGRESPFIARENGNPGGDWNPFPSFAAYGENTPTYDAFPSGHLATIMSAFTVITTNYPEVKWLKPVGYSAIGLLSFQMVQSEVHWISDYPLALLIGYFSGKNIARNRFVDRKKNGQVSLQKKYDLRITGNYHRYGFQTLGLKMTF
jgi:membrane-associated phospholipid phosphatase